MLILIFTLLALVSTTMDTSRTESLVRIQILNCSMGCAGDGNPLCSGGSRTTLYRNNAVAYLPDEVEPVGNCKRLPFVSRQLHRSVYFKQLANLPAFVSRDLT
ncbi:hypothetical protein BKA65DRAFT_486734 [Rhexocercosporidium sp. MPI-PUGE-AT-0058]|nr:hypothetical protein BKA65DRAFT_486734 [Rhexocercosporidium sp. MPI-PUGE-AT-0058]